MTLNQSALLQITDALRTADGGEVMRQMLGFMLQALVDAEATSVIGAAPHERTEDRTTRLNGRVVSQAVVIATGVSADGRREVLGSQVGDSESKAFWTEVLRSLRERGLDGVQLVISDHHRGLMAAIDQVMAGSTWQRCRVHFHAQRAHPGPQGVLSDGRRHNPHDLRPTQRATGT